MIKNKFFVEWLKFLRYREDNKDKNYCDKCKKTYKKQELHLCYLIITDKEPQIIYR